MLKILQNALCRMTFADFYQGAPGNPQRMGEIPVSERLSGYLRQAVLELYHGPALEVHLDIAKYNSEFAYVLKEDWLPVRNRYRDLFGISHRGSVRPDICAHTPGNIKNNQLAIEVKCNGPSGFKIYHDFRKLRLYTDPDGLRFQAGVFLNINGTNQGPIQTLLNWADTHPRSVYGAPALAAQLAQVVHLATPAPVTNHHFHVWNIPRPVFLENGRLDPKCIQEISIGNDFPFGEYFINQDYPLPDPNPVL